MNKLILTLALLVGTTFSFSQKAQDWKIDKSHSSVTFAVNHMVSAVTGKFHEFEGQIKFDKDDLKGSKATFEIQVASIDTDDESRDKHLKSEDFFNESKFSTIKFVSSSFEKVSDTEYNVKGKFTMHGVTKEVTLNMKITGVVDNPWTEGAIIMGVTIETKLNRTDYEVGNGDCASDKMVGHEVTVRIAMELDGKK